MLFYQSPDKIIHVKLLVILVCFSIVMPGEKSVLDQQNCDVDDSDNYDEYDDDLIWRIMIIISSR